MPANTKLGTMRTVKRVCFDIETEPFSEEFRKAESLSAKQRHAPKMRVACVYFEDAEQYRFFTADEVQELIAFLKQADEVISFNGKGFDILLLRRHYGLTGKVPEKGRHTDVHELLTDMAGFRVSLDKASRLNLQEAKHTAGREMSGLDLKTLKEACQSDVSQTYRLWLAHSQGTLRAPERMYRTGISDLMGGPGSHMPDICPNCHDVGSIMFVESDTEEMTDGQFAEYFAGTQGVAICMSCQMLVAWNV